MPGWLSWLPRSSKASPQDPIEAALRELGIRHFDEDLLEMKIADLRLHFGYATTDSIRIKPFLLNVIWQLHERILSATNPDGLPEFYKKRGFIRGMWYHIKGRIDRYKPLRGNYYGSMITALAAMVRAGVVSYRDFNFRDRDANLYQLGTDNPHVLFFAEKDGFITILEELRDLYGCTIITLGGTPSLMSSNYLVSDMVAAGFDLTQQFVCFSLVDFDPDGWDTAVDFMSNLDRFGIKNVYPFRQYGQRANRLDLFLPERLSGDEVARFRFNLPARTRRSPLCATWAALTGGVDGHGSRKYGLESDELKLDRIGEIFGQAVTPFLRTSPELVQRRRRMRELERAVTDFMVYKMLHPKRPRPPARRPGPLPPVSLAGGPDPAVHRQPATLSRRRAVRSSARPPR